MTEVEVCKVKQHKHNGEPFEMVVVLGCEAWEAADDALVEAMDGDDMWRLRRVRR